MAIIDANLHVDGTLSAKSMTLPSASVNDAQVVGNAQVAASKLQMQHQKSYANESGTTAVTEKRVLHIVRPSAGATVVDFKATVVVANIGAATITFDLLKNGTTILTGAISFSNADAAYAVKSAAGFTSTTLAQNDVLEVSIVATAGGGTLGKGAAAQVTLRENSQ